MTTFPVAIIADGALVAVHRHAVGFTGPDGVKHPSQAWSVWTAEDWAEKCPDWTVVPLVDPAPADTDTHRQVRNAEADWTVSADAVTVTYTTVSKTAEEIAADVAAQKRRYGDAIQRHLDATAQARGYDSALSAISYVGCINPQWVAEGEAVRDWRGAVWQAAYEILAEVEAGTREKPTEAELIALLPVITWPS